MMRMENPANLKNLATVITGAHKNSITTKRLMTDDRAGCMADLQIEHQCVLMHDVLLKSSMALYQQEDQAVEHIQSLRLISWCRIALSWGRLFPPTQQSDGISHDSVDEALQTPTTNLTSCLRI